MATDGCCCIWLGLFMMSTWYFLGLNWFSMIYNVFSTITSFSLFYYVYVVLICALNYCYILFIFDAINRDVRHSLNVVKVLGAILIGIIIPQLINWILICREVRVYLIMPIQVGFLLMAIKEDRDGYRAARRSVILLILWAIFVWS